MSGPLSTRAANGEALAACEQAARAAWLSTDLLCVAGGDGVYQWLNPAWERLLGWTLDELMAQPFTAFVHPDDVERTDAETARVRDEHYALAQFENRYRARDGSWRWLEWSAYTDGSLWYGSARDVTERKGLLDRLERRASLLDQVDAAVFATDLEGKVIEWNHSAERLSGCPRDKAIGRPLSELPLGPEDHRLAEHVTRAVQDLGSWEGEHWVRSRDGGQRLTYVRKAVARDAQGEPTGMIGISVDVTDRVETERQLRSAQTFLAAVTEHIGDGVLTLDAEGRATFVNPAAERMLGWSREQLVGKVVHDVIHDEQLERSDFHADDCPMRTMPAAGRSARVDDDAFVCSDGTLLPVSYSCAPFVTPDGVRGSVILFSDVTERRARDRELRQELDALSWVGRIRDALDQDRLVLYAQPIIDLRTGTTVRHELLLRMLGPDGSVVLPGNFLPIAERYGLIGEIDRWVIDEAIRLAADGFSVELNLSGESMADPDIFHRIESALRDRQVAPAKLVVEITETALITNEAAARQFARRLESIGCGLALDDFGTGYGGFTYLKRLPVRYVKIDREFVEDLAGNEASRHVVEAIVNLGRGFGARTIAEGVEDEAALEILRSVGVDYAQGFLISRPYPAAEMAGMLGARDADLHEAR